MAHCSWVVMIHSFIEKNDSETRTEVPLFLFGISMIGFIASDQSTNCVQQEY